MSEPVEVRILDRGFTVGVEPDERENLMQAAQFLDTRMREVRGNNRSAALDRVAVLTALNLAAELLQARKSGGSNDQALARALGDMNRKLDGLFDSLASR
ncbi:MAG: cell division protein ZapA [Arenimonas sp.]